MNKKSKLLFNILKIIIFLFLSLTLISSLFLNNDSSRKIIFGLYQNEPKIFVDSKGFPAGIFVDIIKEIAKIENWEIEFYIDDWQDLLDALLNEKIDLMPDVVYSEERNQIFDFNKINVLESFSSFYSNKKLKIKRLSDINNRKVAVLSNSIQEKNLILLKQNLLFNYELIKVNSFADGFNIVRNGIADCVIANNFYGNYFYKDFGLKKTDIELFPVELFFAVKKEKNKDILLAIDKNLSNWKSNKNSIYFKILKKWSVSFKQKQIKTIQLILFISITFIVSISLYLILIFIKLKKAKRNIREILEFLNASERHFKEYAELSPIGIFKIDRYGKIKYINRLMEEFIGANNEKMDIDSIIKIIDDKDKEEIKEQLIDSIKNIKIFEKNVRIKNKDNKINYIKLKIKPIFKKKGELDSFIGIFIDMTDEMILQKELKERINEINLLFEFSSVINRNALNQDLINKILKLIIKFFSSDAVCLFLYKDNKIICIDAQPDEISNIWKIDREHVIGECICGKAIETGESIFVENLENEKIATRDECREAGFKSIAAVPLKYVDKILGIILIAYFNQKDLIQYKTIFDTLGSNIAIAINNSTSHLKILNYSKELEKEVFERTQQLNDALEKAQYADRMKSAFLATMSHELRTPLNSIIGFTGVLLQELPGSLNEEQKKQLKMVKKSSEHLLELINDVLDISKIEAGELKLSYEKFFLIPFIQEIVISVSTLIQSKGLDFELEIDDEVSYINTDKRRLKQVIINLLSNAIKFTHKGKISFICQKQEEFIEFSIKDTGIGIKEEDKKLLFQPFSQINHGLNRSYEGTGLGLSICKSIVNLLGGDISIESEYDKGSTFKFKIPANI